MTVGRLSAEVVVCAWCRLWNEVSTLTTAACDP